MGLVLWSETTTCYDLPEAMRKHSYYGLDGNEMPEGQVSGISLN